MVLAEDVIVLDVCCLGVISDIHANPFALEAVLDHGAHRGVDRWLVLGDVVAMGPDPGGVIDLLMGVDLVGCVAGNTERYVLTLDRPDPTLDDVLAKPSEFDRAIEVSSSFGWTKGYLAGRDKLGVLAGYSPSLRLEFPDGTRVLAVHASMLSDSGPGLSQGMTPEELRMLFPDPAADLVFGGHTHQQLDRVVDGLRFVNPGSVSNHSDDTDDARYAVVDVAQHVHRVELCDVPYDRALAIAAIENCGIPGAGFLLDRYFGR